MLRAHRAPHSLVSAWCSSLVSRTLNSPVLDAVRGLFSLLADGDQEGGPIQRALHREDAVLPGGGVVHTEAVVAHIGDLQALPSGSS